VAVLCRVMGVSASAYYAWANPPENTEKTKQRAALEAKAKELFYENRQTYGYRRLSDALHPKGIKARSV